MPPSPTRHPKTRRDNQPENGPCARHPTPRSSPPPRHQILIQIVARFSSRSSRYIGAPLALEDHAIRACFAALAIREGVREKAAELRRARGIEAQVRIGLNSGDVVVLGVGTDLHMEYDAIGATVHLAARMEQTAPPDRIRLTSSTARLAGGSMEVEALGPVPVAGFTDPVPVFELVAAIEPELRAEPATPSPLVGRAAELEVLRGAALRARHGRGQLVVVTGEAGIGKSRLCAEIVRELRGDGWLCLSARAAPHEKSEPWLAVRRMMRSFFGTTAEPDAAQKVRDRISASDIALAASAPACGEARNKDPVSGVIGFQKGPLSGDGVHSAPEEIGSRDWDAGCGDDCQDPPGAF
ncbi:MAG: adenylate/guanylate cyclase domain-containing protein, partial [Euzebya sp.]